MSQNGHRSVLDTRGVLKDFPGENAPKGTITSPWSVSSADGSNGGPGRLEVSIDGPRSRWSPTDTHWGIKTTTCTKMKHSRRIRQRQVDLAVGRHRQDPPHALGQPLLWADGYATNVLFSPDGHKLAAGMTGGTVHVWDVTNPAAPQRYADLTGVTDEVFGVAFSADSSQVSGAGSDRTVRIWDLQLLAARTTVCTPAKDGMAMTTEEWARLAGPLQAPTTCS